MSVNYRQTLSDAFAARVEAKRAALGLTIQELTLFALALLCEEKPQEEEKPPPKDGMLSFD